MQHEAVDNRRRDKECELKRYDAPDVALSEIREISRIFSVSLVAENDESDATEQAHRSDRGHNGGQAEIGHEQAVPSPAKQAHENADDDEQGRSGAGLSRHTHQRRSQRHNRSDGEIELTRNDEKRHRQRDEALLGESESEVGERPGVEKIGGREAVESEHSHSNRREQRLPAHEPAPKGLIETVRNKT